MRGMRGRGSHRPRYFLLALFVVGHNTKKKRIGIINSLLHLLLSGANCVFVYIILCWPNGLKVLVPVLPAFKVFPLPSTPFKLPLLSFLWANCGFVGGGGMRWGVCSLWSALNRELLLMALELIAVPPRCIIIWFEWW